MKSWMIGTLANLMTLLLLPILLIQAILVWRRTLRLPEAAGPKQGQVAGELPPLRVVVLGESTVAGVGAANHALALTGQMALALAKQTGRHVEWLAVGQNGVTAKTTYQQLLPQLKGQQVDLVVIALGVNDVTRLHGPRMWRRDLERLIRTARQMVGPVPVVIAGLAPLAHFPAIPQPLRMMLGLQARSLDAATCELISQMSNVVHLPTSYRDDADFAPDGYHPGPKGYAAWGQALAEVAAELVTDAPSLSSD